MTDALRSCLCESCRDKLLSGARYAEGTCLHCQGEAMEAEAGMLREALASERHGNAATVIMLRNDVSAANREIADLRQQLAECRAAVAAMEGRR